MTSNGTASAPKFYCGKVQTTDGATWFAGVELNSKLDHPSELLDATFNLTITDGQRAWIEQDLAEFSLGQTIVDRIKHALEALVQYHPPSEEYFLKFTEQQDPDGALLVEIEWDDSRHGKDVIPRIHTILHPAADNAATIRELMHKILQESALLRRESAELTAVCTKLGNGIESEANKLDSYASRKEGFEESLALKLAALLLAKEQHLNELKRR